jgi:hypothetical protein
MAVGVSPQVVAAVAPNPASKKPAVATPTSAPAPAPEPPPLDSRALQQLRTRWNEFKGIVRQQCGLKVQAAVNSVRDIAVGAGAVAFAFGENHFARDMIARPENLEQVTTILGQILGRPVTLECQLGEQAKLTNMVLVQSAAQENGAPDPLVQYAVSQLHAELMAERERES